MGNEECTGTATRSLAQIPHGTNMIQHFWPVWNMESKKERGGGGSKRTASSNPFSDTQLKIMRFKPCISSGNHDGNLQRDVEI